MLLNHAYLQGRLLQRVANDFITDLHQRVAGGHDDAMVLLGPHYLLQQQVVRGQGASLVKAAHLNL